MPFHTPIAIVSLISLRAIYHKIVGEPEHRESAFLRILRIAGIIIGVCIVTYLIREVGWEQIHRSLAMIGWGYAIVITYPLIWIILNTAGWRFAFHAQYAVFRMIQIRG